MMHYDRAEEMLKAVVAAEEAQFAKFVAAVQDKSSELRKAMEELHKKYNLPMPQ